MDIDVTGIENGLESGRNGMRWSCGVRDWETADLVFGELGQGADESNLNTVVGRYIRLTSTLQTGTDRGNGGRSRLETNQIMKWSYKA